MGRQLPPLKKGGGHSSPPLFGPCLLWPNSWMDQDSTWYGGRSRPRRHCVRWGPISIPHGKRHSSHPSLRLMSIMAKPSPISATAELVFSIKPNDWLERTSPTWPILCRVRRKTLAHKSSTDRCHRTTHPHPVPLVVIVTAKISKFHPQQFAMSPQLSVCARWLCV